MHLTRGPTSDIIEKTFSVCLMPPDLSCMLSGQEAEWLTLLMGLNPILMEEFWVQRFRAHALESG